MKASVCFVFAVVCWIAVQAEESPKILMLNKVLNELNKISRGMDKITNLNSPTINDLKDSCVACDLECFRSQVFNLSVPDQLKRSPRIIARELLKTVILKDSCKPGTKLATQCKSCDLNQKVDSQTFVQNFQTLLQKIYASQA